MQITEDQRGELDSLDDDNLIDDEQEDYDEYEDDEEVENSPELTAHQPLDASASDSQVTTSISDLPITVSVHVGTFSMPLKEIESLKENDLIMVEPFYQNKVSLRVGNSEIGVGKIVSVNGDVAIQIIRLWS